MQPHLKVMTDLGRGYHIRCRYKNREAAIKEQHEIKPLALTSGDDDDAGGDRRDYARSLSFR
jgi:hypothetical protein